MWNTCEHAGVNLPPFAAAIRNDHPMALYGKRKTYELPSASRAPLSATRRMLQTRVTYEQHAKAHRAAEELGVSVSALLAELVDRMRVDGRGRPSWQQSRYAPKPAQADPSEPLRMSA